MGTRHSDKSDYTAGYVLIEYTDLLSSPSGKYLMDILGERGDIGLILQ